MATLQDTTVNSTGAMKLPIGTTAQRPTAESGMIRYNSSLGYVEIYNGSSWERMGRTIDPTLSTDPFQDLDQLTGQYTGTQSLYTDFYRYAGAAPSQISVNFSDPNLPKYVTSSNAGADNYSSGVNGAVVSLDGTFGGCSEGTDSKYTLYGAMRACILAGGRLCTRAEILAGAAGGTGCGHDANGIWTSTPDGTGGYYIVYGIAISNGGGPEFSAAPTDMTTVASQLSALGFGDPQIGIRCCFPQSGTNTWDLRG